MKEPTEISVEILEPACSRLSSDKLFHVRLAIGAQAIRYGVHQAVVVSAPDDYPNLVVNFLDVKGKPKHTWHFNIDTEEFIRTALLCLPEPTRQPDDPVDLPCPNGKNCDC